MTDLNNYYVDNIYMYGKQASDIGHVYKNIDGIFNDITHDDYPENLMNYIYSNSSRMVNKDNSAYYEPILGKLRSISQKSKFPLVKWLISVAVVFAVFMILIIARNGMDDMGKTVLFTLLGVFIIYGIPSGIIFLLVGAVKRDDKSYRDYQRAAATDIYFMQNQIAVVTHGYDYPDYREVINPVGRYIPKETMFANINHESLSLYRQTPEVQFPFNQVFLIDSINSVEKTDGLMRLSVRGTVYSLYKKFLGTVVRNGKMRMVFSQWTTYGTAQNDDIYLVLPDMPYLDNFR